MRISSIMQLALLHLASQRQGCLFLRCSLYVPAANDIEIYLPYNQLDITFVT